jgi:hypothetical protein
MHGAFFALVCQGVHGVQQHSSSVVVEREVVPVPRGDAQHNGWQQARAGGGGGRGTGGKV